VDGDASTAELERLASGVVVFALLFALAQTKCKDTRDGVEDAFEIIV